MRNAFADELTKLAVNNSQITLLSGDIGNRLFDSFKKECPERFFNCGVAEANMTSTAAGMALCGLRPITYTITPFNTLRCLEQIKIDVCYHNLPVIIVGVGAGLSYAELGSTHHSLDDIGLLRMLPGMTVICPGDAVEVRLALRSAIEHQGPVYIRLGKKNEPVIFQEEPSFEIGKGTVISEGSKVCILSTGNILPMAIKTSKELEKENVSTQVVSMHTVKPLDVDLLKKVFSSFQVVVSIEEHSLIGGLGSAIAEWMADNHSLKSRLCRVGVQDAFLHKSGKQEIARNSMGLNPKAITKRVQGFLAQVNGYVK